ncbi:MAG: hypothetical protein JO020_17740 [Chloroflexi bacterium]|nr:hypothetical protein [Chloroflexota bacterium]MBV9896007.1 hypothetical protein [Chloroflexota bacterium]
MTLLVVLAAGVGTAWWAAHTIGMNLSAIQTVAAVLGINETADLSRPVGYSQVHAQATDSTAAPYCQPGQAPTFANGLQTLHQQIGNVMGLPVECEHSASVGGDTVQQTSTGLAAYSSVTNTDSFTDGWHHWALTPNGLVAWEGTDAAPPVAAPSPGQQAATPSENQ